MRIDGTDASLPNLTNSQNTSVPANVTRVKTKEKIALTDNKIISQLSDFDKKEMPISEKVLIEAIEKANRAISGANRRFEFTIHEKTKEIMIKVIDSDTNDVVREIPPEKILDMVARMWEMLGLIVDERR